MLLHFNTFGNKKSPAVVLLHGLFGMSDNLTGLSKQLSEHYFVIAPDLINHGYSPHRPLMDYSSMAADVINLLDDMGVHLFSLLGHSMGGKVAMQIASIAPKNVQCLIVADIAPVTYKPLHNAIIEQMHKVSNKDFSVRKDVDVLLSEAIPELSLRQFFMKNMYRDSQGFWRWRFGLKEITDAYPLICQAPSLESQYLGPVLFIKGELSEYITQDYQEIILFYYPDAKLKTVQGVGHWLHAEKPLVFNRLVERFMLECQCL